MESPPYPGVNRAVATFWSLPGGQSRGSNLLDGLTALKLASVHCCAPRGLIARSFAMRCTVPVPIPSDLATLKIQTPYASCFRTLRSVALSICGRPSARSPGAQGLPALPAVAQEMGLHRANRGDAG